MRTMYKASSLIWGMAKKLWAWDARARIEDFMADEDILNYVHTIDYYSGVV